MSFSHPRHKSTVRTVCVTVHVQGHLDTYQFYVILDLFLTAMVPEWMAVMQGT